MSQQSIKGWEYHIDTSFINKLSPINILSQKSRARLLKKAKFENIPKGGKILRDKEDHWIIFLLAGSMMYEQSDADHAPATDSGNQLSQPIFNLARHSVARFSSNSQIIRFDKKLYELLLQEDRSEQSKIKDIEMSDLEQRIFFQILNANQQGTLDIMGLESSAYKLKAFIKQYGKDHPALHALLGSDPVFTGKLIREANSELFIGMPKVGSLEEALNRISSSQLENLAISHTHSMLFRDNQGAVSRLATQVYSHSARIAAWCATLARKSGKVNPQQAFLAGLLHDIGKILFLQFVEEERELPTDKRELNAMLDKMQPLLSPMIVSKWGLDQVFVNAAEEGHDFARFSTNLADCTDIVIAAHWCSAACRDYRQRIPLMRDIAAFRKLGLEYLSNKDLAALHQEVEHLLQAPNIMPEYCQAS